MSVPPAAGRGRPAAEIAVDRALVKALLEEQHPDLARLAISEAGESWDNCLFRLGDALVARLPRRAAAAPLIEQEHRWLPELAPGLPLPVPVPLRVGRPGGRYPWFWSITRWFAGDTAVRTLPTDPATGAALGAFLRALHRPAPADAPRNPWRGIPLAQRTPITLAHLNAVAGRVDAAAAHDLWTGALAAAPWSGPPLWIHGDLHNGNLVVREGRIAAVIDFGDLSAGDPATDLAAMWMALPRAMWPAFIRSASSASNPVDDDTWMRARGWALAFGLAFLAHGGEEDGLAALGRRTIDAALPEAG